MNEPLGTYLRNLRQEKGWRQEALAQAAGIGVSTLARWERGTQAPRLLELKKTLAALGAEKQLDHALLLSGTPRAVSTWHDLTPPHLSIFMVGPADLWRTLRVRRGLSETEVARHLKLHPSNVSKWESARCAPPEDRLEELFALLRASPQEREELRKRRLAFLDPWRFRDASPEEWRLRFEAMQQRCWSFDSFPGDLEYLVLEAALAAQIPRDCRLLPILVQVWTEHAGYLIGQGRVGEASPRACRAIETLHECGQPAEYWVQAAHVYSASVGQHPDGDKRQAFRLLAGWCETAQQVGGESGVYRELAGYAFDVGKKESASKLLEEARRIAERREEPISLRLAELATAHQLWAGGYYREALQRLPAGEDWRPDGRRKEKELQARIYLGLGDRVEAAHALSSLYALLDQHPDLERYRKDADGIAELL